MFITYYPKGTVVLKSKGCFYPKVDPRTIEILLLLCDCVHVLSGVGGATSMEEREAPELTL